ncbi:nuclease-related domain-containing protein [Halobacillus locisalis]|nr:nuclease-related domain-containing protein [Halobacillus locisalis]
MKTDELLQLEVCIERLDPASPSYSLIKQDFLRRTAGYVGESTVDRYLQYLPPHAHSFQDLRLFDGIQHFQMDFLLLIDGTLTIVEVKNYKGKIIFDFNHQQLIRELDGREDIFPDPFIQVEHHTVQLSRWLSERGFPLIPIQFFVVISNPQTLIETRGHDSLSYKKRIMRARRFPHLLQSLKNPNDSPAWTDDDRDTFIRIVANENSPYNGSVMKKYGIMLNDLQWGVECPACSKSGMKRRRDHWHCECGRKSDDAHKKLLMDYALLLGPEITNATFRQIAFIDSEYIARKLLTENCRFNFGNTKNRRYYINMDI